MPFTLTSDWTDAELVKLVLAGDAAAGNEFVDRYSKLIYSILIRQCGIPVDQQNDAYQYVFEKLYEDDCRRLKFWRGESALSTFLYVVVRNLGRDFREKESGWARRLGPGEDEEVDSFSDDDAPTPEDELLVSQMEQIIGGLLDSLEEICRKIVDLRFMKDKSYKEIALAAGITVSNVGVRLHRCLDSLAMLMKREFPNLFEDRFHLDM